MKATLSRLSPLLLVASLLGGCSSTPYAPVGLRGPDLTPATNESLSASAEVLMEMMEFSQRDQLLLSRRLEEYLVRPDIVETAEESPITAVAVYSVGEGGFIIKGGGGEGLVSFHGGDEAVPFEASGYTVGAVIGGGSSKGIALAFGLVDQRRFAGEYSTGAVRAKLGTEGVSAGNAHYQGEGGHLLRYFSTGSGASADAGVGEFSVRFTK